METSSQRPASQVQHNRPPRRENKWNATSRCNMGHDYTFLTFKMFKINNAFVPGRIQKINLIKISGSTCTRWNLQMGKGKRSIVHRHWGYNHDARVLDLIPNDKNQKQTEWNVIFNDDMVVFTGTKTFDNKGTQIQLIRMEKID